MVLPEVALSRRERQVMEIVHGMEPGEATAAAIREAMSDPPTDAAVRSTLRILVEKGHLTFSQVGPRYLYAPTVPRTKVRKAALARVVETFFDGSTEGVVAALLDDRAPLSPEERARLRALIDRAAEEGR